MFNSFARGSNDDKRRQTTNYFLSIPSVYAKIPEKSKTSINMLRHTPRHTPWHTPRHTPEGMDMELTPITLEEANFFVAEHHRHHKPVVGHKFSIGVATVTGICGVIIVGRPVSRHLDDGWTLEVNRCCTDGTPNACSKLYGAARRVAFFLGYKRLVTYTLPEEGGASLRGSGWRCIGERGGGKWDRKNRPRVDTHPTQGKSFWEAC